MTNSEVKQLEERNQKLQEELRRTRKELNSLKNANGEERKHWEANSASREQLDFLLSRLPVVYWAVDREQRITRFQGAGLELLGLESGKVYGQPLKAVLGDSPELNSAIGKALSGVVVDQSLPVGEHILECRLEPQWNAEGDVVGVRGVAMINDQQEASSENSGPSRSQYARSDQEANRFEWLKVLPDFVLLVDPQGTIRFINRTIPPLNFNEVVGGSIYDFVVEDAKREVEELLKKTFTTGEIVDHEIESNDPDGQRRLYQSRIGPYETEGKISTAIMIARDVTELRKMEETIRKRQSDLEHLSRVATMGEMTAILAHYLNNPLAAISNYAHGSIRRLQAQEGDMEQLMDAQREIVDQCNRSSDYIRHLRAFLQKRETRFAESDLTDILIDAVRLTEPELRAEGVSVRIENRESNVMVFGDPLQIEQVLVNLFLNAVDSITFADQHGSSEPEDQSPREIVVQVEETSPGEVTISVVDSGRGLTPGFEERIFEPFFTTQDKRLGMGLSVCRSIVEAHGGRLEAINNAGAGATFRFNLPRGKAGGFHE